MAGDVQNPEVQKVEGLDAGRLHAFDAEDLPRDAVRVLLAGHADRGGGHIERTGDLQDGAPGRHAHLLDPGVDVVPAAAGVVQGDLFDDEVLVVPLDHGGDGSDVRGQIGPSRGHSSSSRGVVSSYIARGGRKGQCIFPASPRREAISPDPGMARPVASQEYA
jgi:hypothetical protein